ncbi:NAD(P)-dependent oxidoreductase [Streptomyces spiramyceticus]|uniref:NAD(P)-dependent oxidoreductase n=1 Tax=Streptomyces spiramyceticus TaxID=299717 RepID=UPI00237A1DC8|nr:NAD(P)H-binding protein [Streptomyces spiramyceticus]
MKLTVFGATGGIGQEIVKQALAAGHRVTAVVRDPARFTVTGRDLEVFTAQVTDAEALRPAVAGRDAVLSGLGARTRKDAGIAATLTRPVLRAMEAEGTRRLLVVSAGPLAPVPRRQPLVDRLTLSVINTVLKDVYADLRVMEDELARSATDWTSVRPPKLLNRPVTGTYRTVIGGNPPSGRTIARADVAHAMLKMIDDPATVGQGVGVAY